jgi:hypothetical protein
MIQLNLTQEEAIALENLIANLRAICNDPHIQKWSDADKLKLLLNDAPDKCKEVETVYRQLFEKLVVDIVPELKREKPPVCPWCNSTSTILAIVNPLPWLCLECRGSFRP